jgi:N-acetylneuraminic acid mutarotase
MELMTFPLTRPALFALAAVTLAACNETPAEPENSAAPAPAAEFAATASNTWTRKADLPGGTRTDVTLASVTNAAGQSILYVIGGRTVSGSSVSRVQAYNASTNVWTYRSQLPTPLYSTNGAGVINGKIYVSGGRQQKDNKDSRVYLYMYDPAQNTWTRKQDMPWYTAAGITGVIDNELYVLTCGVMEFCTYEGELAVYRYDAAADQWTSVATSPFTSEEVVGAAVNRKFYFVSDRGAHLYDHTTELTEYDPATNSWTIKARPPKARTGGAAVALGAKLYLIGGFERQADGTYQQVRTVRVYNPATNSWSTRASLPQLRPGAAAGKVTLNGLGRIELVGGPAPGNNLQYVP